LIGFVSIITVYYTICLRPSRNILGNSIRGLEELASSLAK